MRQSAGKYSALMMTNSTTTVEAPRNFPRKRSGTPATNIIAVPIGKKTRDDPKSGSFNINRNGSAVIPRALRKTPGINISSFGRVKKSAKANINANFANSEG